MVLGAGGGLAVERTVVQRGRSLGLVKSGRELLADILLDLRLQAADEELSQIQVVHGCLQ